MTNILLQSLDKYYNNGKNIENFNDYVNGEKKISLRIIDWFVTNYSKKFNVFALAANSSIDKLSSNVKNLNQNTLI